MIRPLPLLLLFASCIASIAHADGTPAAAAEDLIVFSNGDQLHGHLEGLSADRVTWRNDQADASIRFAMTRISRVELPRTAAHPPAIRVLLATGESLPCDAVALDDTKAELDTGYGGKLTLPRKIISRIEFISAEDRAKQGKDDGGENRLTFKNGDTMSGQLLGIAGGKAKISSDTAGVVEIPLDRLRGIALQAPVAASEAADPALLHLRLVSGGLLAIKVDRLEAGILHGRHPHAGDLRVKLEAVEAIGVADADPHGWKTTASGLRYRIVKAGEREHPGARDTVKVNYELRLKDGKQVDASAKHGGPNEFPLDGVVKGFAEGTRLIGKGGKIELVVPPELGYGDTVLPQLPASSTLYFTVELVDFTPKGGND